ncbi:MAG TPA: NADP-dependent methylenetetrahydromethanopterin/methylenetetrahydrofolate dehydrogenase [Pirellulaceae bacterium]|nr:NADP-dependent methylenetetrahydromethanopterin/methylenetetrahydrofolate dehydrogenase [Pirellulaceae bacterium]
MSKPKILLQLDSDTHASVFDAVVALDADVNHLLQYREVESTRVRELVHGAMFTRGVPDLKSTAIFIGGSSVKLGEQLLEAVKKCFFGPLRVSVMLDANGANTTAAAAVLAARKHVELAGATVAVLGGTGPVGQRAARLLAGEGALVRVASRDLERAQQVCDALGKKVPPQRLSPHQAANSLQTSQIVADCQIVIAAGAAGVELLSSEVRQASKALRVAIDLNAVPPAGIAGIDVMDKAVEHEGVICYGAIGVGGTKMKIHKAAIRRLFESNDLVLDAEEIYELGKSLSS